MAEDFNHIDQFYKSKLDGYTAREHEDAHWNKMEKRLFWYKYRKYLWGGLLLLLISFGAYYTYIPSGNVSDEIVLEKLMSNHDSNQMTTTLTTTIESQEIPENNTTKEAKDHIEITKEHASLENPVITSAKHRTTAKPQRTEEISIEITELSVLQDHQNPNKEKQALTQKTQDYTDIEQIAEVFIAIEKEVSLEEEQVLAVDSIQKKNDEVENLVDAIPPTPTDPANKKLWISLSAFASGAYTNATLQGDQSYENYISHRNEHESPAFSWTTGAGLQLHYNNWFVETGFSYAVYSQNRNYNYSYEALDTNSSYFRPDTVWGWAYDPPDIGKPIVIGIDSTWMPVYHDIQVDETGKNEWTYIEIPLLIGYQLKRNKLSFDISTGVSYGFLISAKARLPDFTDHQSFSNLDKNSPEIKQQMLNYLLHVGVQYEMNSYWSLYAKPYYKQNLQSVF